MGKKCTLELEATQLLLLENILNEYEQILARRANYGAIGPIITDTFETERNDICNIVEQIKQIANENEII